MCLGKESVNKLTTKTMIYDKFELAGGFSNTITRNDPSETAEDWDPTIGLGYSKIHLCIYMKYWHKYTVQMIYNDK